MYRVANTNGEGVYLRRSPSLADRLAAWPEGTRMVAAGDVASGDGLQWALVVDPAGNVGYVPLQYLVSEGSIAPAAPPPVQRPAAAAQAPPSSPGLSGRYLVTVERVADDLYRDQASGVYFVTSLCLSLALGDEAVFDADRMVLRFDDGERCDAATVAVPGTNAFTARVDGEFQGWDGDTTVVLTNGQVWRQASYTYTYHYAYRPRVLVYAHQGGWWMHVENVSTPVRVRRVA